MTRPTLTKRTAVTKKSNAGGEHAKKYNLAELGDFVISLLNRDWFDGLFDPAALPYVTRLALGLFVRYQSGLLLKKKDAMAYMSTDDGRTFQRYLQIMEQNGFVTVTQSKLDKRVDWLCPTGSLLALMEKQLSSLAEKLPITVRLLSYTPWIAPSTPSFMHPFTMEARHAIVNVAREQPAALGRGFTVSELNLMKAALIGKEDDPLLQNAIDEYSETIRLAPTNIKALINRGLTYCRIGSYEKAIADFTAALGIQPNNADLYQARASAYVEQKQTRLAISDMQKAINVEPELWSRYSARADLFRKLGQFNEALSDYKEAIRLATKAAPSFIPLLHQGRALVFMASGNKKKAIEELNIGCAQASPYRDDLVKQLAVWKAA
jgi:hypothetical protein